MTRDEVIRLLEADAVSDDPVFEWFMDAPSGEVRAWVHDPDHGDEDHNGWHLHCPLTAAAYLKDRGRMFAGDEFREAADLLGVPVCDSDAIVTAADYYDLGEDIPNGQEQAETRRKMDSALRARLCALSDGTVSLDGEEAAP